jgi:hypothetical protein
MKKKERRVSKEDTAAALVAQISEGELIQEELDFTYDVLESEDKRIMLMDYEGEIRSIIRQSLENVVRLGEIFSIIKDEILPFRYWKAWIKVRFQGEISVSTTHNWINVYQMYSKYSEEHEDALSQISLRDLYMLGRTGIEVDAKEAVLELVTEQKVNPRDTKKVVETYRKIKLANAGIAPEVAKMLTKVEIAENPKYVADFQRLSKRKQQEVAELLMNREAGSPKEALQVIKERSVAEAEVLAEAPVIDSGVELKVDINRTESYRSLSEVATESVDLALVEAPLKFDYMGVDFCGLTKDLANVLVPGGFALITVGHKAAMYVGNSMDEGLKPVHLVCLRRQPGNSSTIIGLNITTASVYMVLAYKPPYRAPRGFLIADLHTLSDSEALPGMDVVETGLEKSFKYLMEPLLSSVTEERPTVLHHVVKHSQHFGLNEYLEETSFELGARSFISVM